MGGWKTISSAAENIAHGVVEDKQQLVRYGNTIVKQSRQLTQLVEQVLLFAATQQPQGRLEHGRVNISEVIDAALEGTNSTVAAAGVGFQGHMEASPCLIETGFDDRCDSITSPERCEIRRDPVLRRRRLRRAPTPPR